MCILGINRFAKRKGKFLLVILLHHLKPPKKEKPYYYYKPQNTDRPNEAPTLPYIMCDVSGF